MKIQSALKTYTLHFENSFDFLGALAQKPSTVYVIDENVYRLYPDAFANVQDDNLIRIVATEENKTIATALDICERMTDLPAKRNAHLIAVGGGIVQDIAGFAANILYRGIPWTLIPTTLLAACDSCIGGKTSLNYKSYKNLLGTFYPPDDIFIAPAFFATLTEQDFKSGLGEVLKFNIMQGFDNLTALEQNLALLLQRDPETVMRYLRSSLQYKKTFIEADEFDRNERIKLNFAHTFGHAIETVSHYGIPHGTAVAIGMLMANDVALERGLLGSQMRLRCDELLLPIITIPLRLTDIPPEQFIAAMRKDKKQSSNQLTAVLLTDANDLILVHDLQEAEVAHAIAHFQQLYDSRNPV